MSTGLEVFDTTLQETNALLKEIEKALRWGGKKHETFRALRAVLHTLRDRLTLEEIAHFSSQLPLLMKGVFYEEWDPTNVPQKMSKEEFLEKIAERGKLEHEDRERITHIILQALKSYVSAGEMEDVKGVLPKDIASLI